MTSNFVPMVFAVLKDKGIDTKNMSVEEAIAKYNELVGKSGRYSVENGEQNAQRNRAVFRLNEQLLQKRQERNLLTNS